MKCNDSVSFSFLFSLFFTKKQIAFFQSKQIVVVLKCPVSVLILLRDRDRVELLNYVAVLCYQFFRRQIRSKYYLQLTV